MAEKLKIISLGGLDEIGKNMTVLEYGDDMIAIGTTSGFISALDDITFAPGSPITWNATVNMSNWTMILDDGQVTASTGGGGDANANQGATQGQTGSP
jgi:hypothetical protein